MALTTQQMSEMDKASGLTPDTIAEMDKVSGIGKDDGFVGKAGNIIGTVTDLLVGRTKDVGELIGGGIAVNQQQSIAAKRTDELFEESRDLIRQARSEKDPQRKQQLLQQSRELDQQASGIADQLGTTIEKYRDMTNVSDADLERSNLDFATRRAGAAAVEQFALLAPGSKELQALQKAAAAKSVFAKMAASGLIGGGTAGALAATDPQTGSFEEAVKKGSDAAVKGAVMSAAIVGGIEVGKAGLKIVGTALKTLVPNKEVGNRIWANALNVPARVGRRLKPLETADEIGGEYGLSGSLDDLQNINKQITGSTGSISRANRSVLGSIKTPIQADDALEAARNQLDLDGEFIDDKVAKKILNNIQSTIKPDANLKPGTMSALEAFSAMQKIEAKGWEMMNKSTPHNPNITAEQIGEAYLAAADELSNLLNQSSADESIMEAIKTPEMIDKLTQISPKLADKFMAAKNISDLRRIQAPFVRLGKMIDLTNEYHYSTFAQNLRGQTGIVKTVANTVLRSPTVQTGVGSAIQKTSQAASNMGLGSILNSLTGVADQAAKATQQVAPTVSGFIQGKR